MSSPKESRSQVSTVVSVENTNEVDDSTKPDFIYGGPFIKVEKPSPFINTTTPINLQLQGTFKKSFAYYSLRERMPVILTKVIDYLSREGNKIKTKHGATDDDIRSLMQYINKLKNDLVTNKKYDLLTVDTPEAKKWNQWIEETDTQNYFLNTWVFTECYVYRRLREGCELTKGLQNFDPFDEQKEKSFQNSLEPMCVVAEKLTTMLQTGDKDKRKADFTTLLKICLWANKCDLSLSMGEQVSLKSNELNNDANQATALCMGVIDPFQMILDFKDKVLVDDSGKIYDQVIAKAEAMAKTIAGEPEVQSVSSKKGSPTASPPAEEETKETEETPKIPCPSKMTIPDAVMFDIVCDNAGYELFSDLCLAHFLIAQGIVQKVRFHVKKIPWFVSDVTPNDFKYVVESCRTADYKKEMAPEIKPEAPEGEAPDNTPRVLNADNLRQLGEAWAKFLEDGTFIVMCDDFWTSPHVYKDMKKYDFNLYRKLQFAVAILFKGDLNYRKLLGERNCNPTLGFEAALQGFMPAPLIALRTVKADLICGLPKGKFEQLNKLDEKWMEKGDYGVIQYCPKSEPLKPSDRPCAEYGAECRGVVCAQH
ncbi:unnamed protein product [Parnassius mnemosyne]|uniref:Sugar phosphate phosphatase n=1 Tax=Parnassius mnemosyne TaxID=213953 RepID=A0AAV1LHD2_9NEOP